MALECDALSSGDGPELRDLVIKNGCVVPLINLAQPNVSVSLSTNTAKPRFTVTSLVRSPLHYGHINC